MKNEHYQAMFEKALEGDGKSLKGYSLFHRYSFANQMWAMMQMLDRGIEVSPIATFKKWQELGRNVQKGSKAIELCMPCTVKDKQKDGTEKPKTIFIFRKNWFAMSQTEGEEVQFPEVEFNFDKAVQTLGLTKEAFKYTDGNAQGYARKGKIFAINPIAEMPHKTFFHEVGHILLGHTEGESEFVDSVTTTRNIQEVEAESVALCCMLALGIEGIEYPRGYIKGWLQAEEIPADSIKKVFRVADQILKAGSPEVQKGDAE
jgi:antirestriction protein ArdC